MDPALRPDLAGVIGDTERRLHTLERRGGSPGTGVVTADVAATESTTSTAYTDLATPGPAVTLTLAPGQAALVIVSATIDGQTALASFDATGDVTDPPIDGNAALVDLASPARVRSSRTTVVGNAGGGPLTVTLTMRYRVTAGTGTYSFRRITAVPL